MPKDPRTAPNSLLQLSCLGHRLPNRLVLLVSLGLMALVFAVFARTLGCGFVNLDDDVYVTHNNHVLKGLSWANVGWALTAGTKGHLGDTDYWMPLSLISHMADVQFFGLHAGNHHAVNVILHALNSVLLFLVLRSMTGTIWRSALVSALWAIHPLRVESVAWIAERKDLLGGLFFMLSLAAYLNYIRSKSLVSYLLILFAFTLGLLSKPIVVSLPLVLLALDYWPLNRLAEIPNPRRVRLLIIEKLPLFALSACSCLMTLLTQQQALNPQLQAPILVKAANAAVATCIYLGKMVFPRNLAAYYPFPPHGWTSSQVILSLVLLAMLTVLVLLQRVRRPYLAVGWFWYLLMLAPASGIVQAGSQAYADRFTYLPQIGLLIAMIWFVAALVEKCQGWKLFHRGRLIFGVLGTGLVLGFVILSAASWYQIGFWQNDITLWMHTLSCTSDNSLPHNNLGNALHRLGRNEEAIANYREAFRIDPYYAEAHHNLGNILYEKGLAEEASVQYREALRIKPDYAEAVNNLACTLFTMGRTTEAIVLYREAIRLKPSDPIVHHDFANALLGQGQPAEAIVQYRAALVIDPHFEKAWSNLGEAFRQTGKFDEAITCLLRALQLNPNDSEAENTLGNTIFQKGPTALALPHYERVVQLNPSTPEPHNMIGTLHLIKGDQRSALAEYQKAYFLNPN